MADRTPQNQGLATRLVVFARAVSLLALIVGVVPVALVWAARERFGGGAPFHGVASPADWRFDTIRTALTDRLTDQTIADVVIRVALVAAWVAVTVLVVTVVGEVVHMVRHDGLAMPDIRGLGMTQRMARVIAAGLLVVIPLVASPAGALARDGASSAPGGGSAIAELARDAPAIESADGTSDASSIAARDEVAAPTSATSGGGTSYTVRSGDSVFGIAERVAGPDAGAVSEFAERLLELNLGRQMPDGRHFSNAAFIDVGWVLELPSTTNEPLADNVDNDDVHVVGRGETLWSIADEELGDPERWPEVYEANKGRAFDDGRVLDDPDLIQPGWDLSVPGGTGETAGDLADLADPADVDGSGRLTPAEMTHVVEPIVDPGVASPSDVAAPANAPERASGAEIERLDAAPVNETIEATDAAAARSPGRDVVWPTVADSRDADGGASENGPETESETDESGTAVLTMNRAAMLSAGILTLLAVRRRRQLRRAQPRARLPEPLAGAAATERALRSSDPGERFSRVEAAIRAAAPHLIRHGQQVAAVTIGGDGEFELIATGPVALPGPWHGADDRWRIDAATPFELVAEAGADVAPPCPTLVQLGTDDHGRDVYVDLEALEAIEVGGPGAHADSIVAAVAATLAGSLLAEVTTLVGLGVPDAAFLDHRLFVPVRDPQRAFEAAFDAIGTTATMTSSTFELRARATAGETWEPAVVLIGSAAGTVTMPPGRTGLAVVSASPILGPSSRLEPDGDAWVLRPAGIRMRPIGLSPDDIDAVAQLVAVDEPEPEPLLDRSALVDHTLVGDLDDEPDGEPDANDDADGDAPLAAVDTAIEPLAHELMVTVMGGVTVVDRNGSAVEFERSKTRELIAWLATHRSRSTRSAARTALWELDVRDATFANVVSEARRSLARLVDPPDGEEWVGRTMTDALPLHELVVTDADLIEHALAAARIQPPAQAIATLQPAVERISGVPFEGTSYLWPDSEGITSNLVLLATTATTELAAHCLSIGDIEGVFAATSTGLQVLPGHEELIGLRMEAYARAGDHAGVRHEWESYERVINADPWSDGEPAPKLVELRRRLLHPAR